MFEKSYKNNETSIFYLKLMHLIKKKSYLFQQIFCLIIPNPVSRRQFCLCYSLGKPANLLFQINVVRYMM